MVGDVPLALWPDLIFILKLRYESNDKRGMSVELGHGKHILVEVVNKIESRVLPVQLDDLLQRVVDLVRLALFLFLLFSFIDA